MSSLIYIILGVTLVMIAFKITSKAVKLLSVIALAVVAYCLFTGTDFNSLLNSLGQYLPVQ